MDWMRSHEIDDAARALKGTAAERYAKFLADWRDTVDSNSDGWTGWRVGAKAADALVVLVSSAWSDVYPYRGRPGRMPDDDEFEAALKPIRDAASRHLLQAPVLAG